MKKAAPPFDASEDGALLALFHAIASHDEPEVTRRLDAEPELVRHSLDVGATRDDARTYFLARVDHYVYRGDTALHVAAAAHHRQLAEALVARGADVHRRNRRGAEPLHYAADGGPGNPNWDPPGQGEVIAFLVDAGANPDALDAGGVAALHRAVRARSATAVSVLIQHGANPRLRNGRGSTPLHLAVQQTGRSNSGSDAAKDEQARIISLLLDHGAAATDLDTRGNTVMAMAPNEWIKRLLQDR